MDTSFDHETETPESSQHKGSVDRRNRFNHRCPKRCAPGACARSPYRCAASRGLHRARSRNVTNGHCRSKQAVKRRRAPPRRTSVHQARLQRQQRTAARRSHAQSSQHTTSNSSSPLLLPRHRSASRKAFSVPLQKSKKLGSPPAEDNAITEQKSTASRTSSLSVTRRATSRVYFRRPSRYKRRKTPGISVRSAGSSDASKSVHSTKAEVINGWEQKSANFSLQECHEAFIKAFAIPTHLYRYLAQRHHQKPLFLDRNLSYLRPPPSTVPSERTQKTSVNTIAERLRGQITRSSSTLKILSKQDLTIDLWDALGIPNYLSPHWPLEIQMIFEGFYDSDKEVDWVTVDASVNLVFRFGWSWRHKTCPSDTLVSPCQTPIPLACHHPARGIDHSPSAVSNALTDCRFSPLDVIDQAKWITSGSRLSSGQLELRVNAVERRWLKRRDINRASVLPSSETASTNSTADRDQTVETTVSAPKNKPGLSGASYPVHYVTAPLPLFYPSSVSGSLHQSHPLLLTPGLYELRLGVDHSSTSHSGLADKLASEGKRVPNGSSIDNGAHDAASTSDSVVTSTSEFPLGTVCSSDEVSSVTSQTSGAVSGRIEWRRVRFPRASDALDEYNRWPTLKFRVVWHGEAGEKDEPSLTGVRNGHLVNGTRDGKVSLIKTLPISIASRNSLKSSVRRISAELSPLRTGIQSLSGCLSKTEICGARPRSTDTDQPSEVGPTALRPVAYRFLYMGHLQQWSESKNLVCPWCQLNCGRARSRGLEALLIHLRSTHPRFRFKAFWGPSRAHLSLEVSLNEAYDGSNDCGLRRWTAEDGYSGHAVMAPGQLLGGWTGLGLTSDRESNASRSLTLAGCASRVSRPIRRLPYTHLIFWRGAERSVNQALDPTLSVRPMAVGHNRVYYHTRSIQPIRACEFDVDSEAEDAPVWLCQHYQRKVEEFTDVNQGEKQIMQLWNSLLLSVGPSQLVVCDNQLVNLCAYFLHRHGVTIHRRRLRNNLLLHFANLVDYGLLSAGQLRQLMVIYDKLIASHTILNNSSNSPGGSSHVLIGPSVNGATTTTVDVSSMEV